MLWNSKLSEQQRQLLQTIVERAKAKEPKDYPATTFMEHEIKLTGYTPIYQKTRRENPKMQKLIEEYVDEMLDNDIIEPSESEFNSPILMVPKENGTCINWRPCINFTKLNEVTFKDRYPMPNMETVLTFLTHCKYLSKVDLTKAFWLIPLTENCRHLTAFSVPNKGFLSMEEVTFWNL